MAYGKGTGEVVDAEVVEGDEALDPTDLRSLFFRKCRLSAEKRLEVEADLKALFKDSEETRADLDNLLVHWNDLAEGISPPKSFPWANSSNLHIPLTETKLNELHSSARSTVLRSDQVYYVKSLGDPLAPQLTSKSEAYLNYKVTTGLGLVGKFSEAVWVAGRDGTAIGHVYYHEEWKDVPKIKSYRSLSEFTAAYPMDDIAGSGLTKAQYKKVLDKFAEGVKVVRLLEEVEECVYRGPKVDIIELKDFRMSPMTSIRTDYARLVGKIFTARGPEIKAMAEIEEWPDDAVERVVTSNEEGRKDQATSTQDQIEGIARTYRDKEKNGDFVVFNGIYRADLNDDGKEERYLVFFHYLSGTLLGIIHYPYIHGKDCFVPVRIKKRPNRFLGRGFCAMLDDMNIEVNTQHNQRIDSRTISTVPSFKVKNTSRNEFDPSRSDSRFFPGKVFYLTDINGVQQLEVKQTDLGESMQEESALMSLSDRLVGSAGTMSGQGVAGDPRAAAKKVRELQAGIAARMDDYFEELGGSGADNEGLNAIGEQVFALLYQFFVDDEIIPLAAPGVVPTPAPAQAPLTPASGPLGSGGPLAPAASGGPLSPQMAMGAPVSAAPGVGSGAASLPPQPPMAIPGGAPLSPTMPQGGPAPTSMRITLEDLEKVQGRVRIGLAKISMAQNPDNALMRFMQVYSLLAMDPLVGGNPKGRLALDRTLLELARIPNAEQYLPDSPQTAQQMMQMQQMILAGMEHAKGGRPGARTRGGAKTPSAGGTAGGPNANGPRPGAA